MRTTTGEELHASAVLRAGLLCLACWSMQQSVANADEPSAQAPRTIPADTRAAAALDQAVKSARADLENRTKAAPEKIRTLSADVLLWTDTSMGCGSPTASYAQIEVEGFRVVLEYAGKRFDYRSLRDGEPILCEGKVSTL